MNNRSLLLSWVFCAISFISLFCGQPSLASEHHLLSTAHLNSITKDEVQKGASSLAPKMALRKVMRKGLLGAGGCMMLYQFYNWFVPAQAQPLLVPAVTVPVVPQKSWKDAFLSGDSWMNGMQSVGKLGANIAIMSLMSGAVGSIMEEDSLVWFTRTYKPYHQHIYDLKLHVEKIGTLDCDNNLELAYHKRGIIAAYNRLITNVKQAISYMQFKQQHLGRQKFEAREVVDHVITTIRRFSIDFQALLNNDVQNHKAVSLAVTEFIQSVEADFARFSVLEGVFWVDINKLMHNTDSGIKNQQIDLLEA